MTEETFGVKSHQKSGKSSFDEIYNMDDPRSYFNTLGEFDYEIPDHGRRVFCALLDGMRSGGRSASEVLDLCCSYGINAALLKHDITLDDLYDRYRSEEIERLSSDEVAEADREFYSGCRKEDAPHVVGLDIATSAVTYGVRAGVLDAGFAENLEDEEPTDELRETIRETDLLTVTGGIGYISERTFDRLLKGMDGSPWVASFALRWVSYDEIESVLARHGLVTEKLDGHSFEQRTFTGDRERDYVLKELSAMDIDTVGKESEGYYHADFYLSRPESEVEEAPLEVLLKDALG